jgi:dTDP-L-rhamnose 4-epimerase
MATCNALNSHGNYWSNFMKILITGGAGFIGSHLFAALQQQGHVLTVIDNFSPQVHDASSMRHFKERFSGVLIEGDITDRHVWTEGLRGQDAVVHLAAETGTGQSMYEVQRYESVNIGGTALMLDCLVNDKQRSVRRLVVASSRAVYGEGSYRCSEHGLVRPSARDERDLAVGQFEPRCSRCNSFVSFTRTAEDAPFAPSSFYGLTKQVQEQMILMYGQVLGLSAIALRYQNVYGPGQSLNNPYTGILAIFSNLARQGRPIQVFEDGHESRDFVYVDDVVKATCMSLGKNVTGVHAVNVGSGTPTSVMQVARSIVEYFGSKSSINVTGAYRKGDIRHNVAELQNAQRVLGFSAAVTFSQGLHNFLDWAACSAVGEGAYERSLDEMRDKGLLVG